MMSFTRCYTQTGKNPDALENILQILRSNQGIHGGINVQLLRKNDIFPSLDAKKPIPIKCK